ERRPHRPALAGPRAQLGARMTPARLVLLLEDGTTVPAADLLKFVPLQPSEIGLMRVGVQVAGDGLERAIVEDEPGAARVALADLAREAGQVFMLAGAAYGLKGPCMSIMDFVDDGAREAYRAADERFRARRQP
ncbi:MAG TPA: hypothetical protein VHN99_09295, partial [Deinococcales bacterium]|nr:hypothetical protein [Deinococcales bacterium]